MGQRSGMTPEGEAGTGGTGLGGRRGLRSACRVATPAAIRKHRLPTAVVTFPLARVRRYIPATVPAPKYLEGDGICPGPILFVYFKKRFESTDYRACHATSGSGKRVRLPSSVGRLVAAMEAAAKRSSGDTVLPNGN